MVNNISSLSNELLDNIIGLIISNATPVHLEYLIKMANHLTTLDLFGGDPSGQAKFDQFQLQHQREWVLVNSVCRRWRFTGHKAFFTQKSFVITTALLKALLAGRHPTLTSPNYHSRILENIHHVVAPMSGRGAASDYLVLPRYQDAFSNLQSLDILTCVVKDDILHEYCVPGFWAYSCDKEPYRELMECLAGIGFQDDKLEIRFPRVRRSLGAAHMQRLWVDVLPILRTRVICILRHVRVLSGTVICPAPFLHPAGADPRRIEEVVGALHDLDQAAVLLAPLVEGVDEGLDVGVVRELLL
ncbi:MAG: hypothetical protein Q9210_001692 [Variospora velana]